VHAFCPGIYPRSETLVQATRDFDRGRTTLGAVEDQVERDLDGFVRVQQEAGLDLLADGMLRWQDLFRPLVEASDGFLPGPLTRFLDTNTFYRAPHATTVAPRLREPLGEPYLAPLGAPRLVTLPSPWALARGTGAAAKAVAEGVLRPQLDALPPDVELAVLDEPFLALEDEPALDDLAEALETLAGARMLALRFVFSDAARVLERGAAELPVDGLGIDFYRTGATAVPEALDKTLLAGVVDARSSLLEDPREIAAFASRLRQRVADVALVPNGDLQFVAEPIAREKVLRLGRAKTVPVEEAA
jgi:5-methyltetrahydropteroyltriglutamate--homocysteine methyltransferase